MVPYFLDFQRISGTSLSNRKNYYSISWSTKKKAYNIRKIFMEQPGNIPIFNIPGTLFRNILRNFIENFFQIYSEYRKGMFHEYSTNNICPVGNGLVKKVTTLVKSSIFDVWYGSISLQFLKNLKLNRLINIEYQHKSNSVTKSYALSINMDHKHGLYSIFHAWTIK